MRRRSAGMRAKRPPAAAGTVAGIRQGIALGVPGVGAQDRGAAGGGGCGCRRRGAAVSAASRRARRWSAEALRAAERGGGALAGQAEEAVIGQDRADDEKAEDGAQFGAVEAEDKGQHGQHARADDQRQDLQPERRLNGHDAQKRAKDGVAEQPAETEAVRPAGSGNEGRGIDRDESHSDGGEQGAADGAVLAAVGQKADAPDGEDQGDGPGRHSPR